MSKNLSLGKKIYDNSFRMFITKLDYKLEQNNKKLIKVGTYFPSSKMCPNCGRIKNHLELSAKLLYV